MLFRSIDTLSGWPIKVSIVRALLAGVMPEPLRGIELRRIGWEPKHFDLAGVFGNVRQDFGLLVIGGVVLNQIDPVAAAVIVRQQFFIQER